MNTDRFDLIPAFFLVVPFLFLLIFANWLGFRFKMRQIRLNPDVGDVGIGPTEGSLLGLTALLLSFTFSMSSSKFETRRQLVVQEANNIGTVILRCDLYPDSIRNAFRSDLKNYLETRIAYYNCGNDDNGIKKTRISTDSISNIIWKRAAFLSHDLNNRVASAQMIPALNAMIDIVSTRDAARKATIPHIIMLVLCVLILSSAFLSGYGSKKPERNQVLVFAFAFITSVALYLIIDLDKPRQGFVNLNSSEQLMENLRSGFQ